MLLRELLGKKRLYLDGGMGTMLQRAGLSAGELPEEWNMTHPGAVKEIHAAYLAAGADIVTTNTFGAYRTKYQNLDEIIPAAVENAAAAVAECGREDVFVAYDVGPLGKLLEPMGDLPFEEAVSIFAESIRIAVETGKVDLILIETMNDAYETKAAVLAAKECCDLPVLVTNVFDAGGRLLTGADCTVMAAMLKSLGVDGVGMNCSLGPRQMAGVAERYAAVSELPLIVSPNAGLPRVCEGKTVYDVTAEEFAAVVAEIAGQSAILGGCCGTDPEFIRCVTELTREIPLQKRTGDTHDIVTSHCKVSVAEDGEFEVGTLLTVDGLDEDDLDDLVDDAMDAAEDDLPVVGLDLTGAEPELAALAVRKVQELVSTPLALKGTGETLSAALRCCNGKPLLLAETEEQAVLEHFPLQKRYGGTLSVLCGNRAEVIRVLGEGDISGSGEE